MLLGLVRPTSGSGRVLGHDLSRPQDYLPDVGALIEAPAFYPGLSGRANLRVLATVQQVCDWLVMVEAGRLVRSGPTAQLLTDSEAVLGCEHAGDLPRLAALLESRALQVRRVDDRLHAGPLTGDEVLPGLNRAAAEVGITLSELRRQSATLVRAAEHLLQEAWTGASRWFPGLLMESVSAGGTTASGLARSATVGATLVAGVVVVAAVDLRRRDILS